jgi:hypothetical protein
VEARRLWRGGKGAHRLEHAERADEVRLDIAFGMIDRVTHAGLRGQVDQRVGPVFLHQVMHDTGRLDPLGHGAEPLGLQQAWTGGVP